MLAEKGLDEVPAFTECPRNLHFISFLIFV